MVSIAKLMVTITVFCQFSNKNISREKKETCMEKFVNCSIVEDGKTTQEQIDKCKEKIK